MNSLIINQDHSANYEYNVDHIDFLLSIVHDNLQTGCPSTMNCSLDFLASQNITWLSPATQSALPTLPTWLVTKYTRLPLC